MLTRTDTYQNSLCYTVGRLKPLWTPGIAVTPGDTRRGPRRVAFVVRSRDAMSSARSSIFAQRSFLSPQTGTGRGRSPSPFMDIVRTLVPLGLKHHATASSNPHSNSIARSWDAEPTGHPRTWDSGRCLGPYRRRGLSGRIPLWPRASLRPHKLPDVPYKLYGRRHYSCKTVSSVAYSIRRAPNRAGRTAMNQMRRRLSQA